MTVSELVAELQKLPPQTRVFIDKQDQVEGNKYSSNLRLLFPLLRRMKNGKLVQRPCKETSGSEKVLVL